jgi:hypothetical protein
MTTLEQRVAARAVKLDKKFVDKLRKDFLVLTGNIPRIRSQDDWEKVRKGLNVWRKHFDSVIFERWLNNLPMGFDEKQKKNLERYVRDPAWSLSIEVAGFPDTENDPVLMKRWHQRVKRKGQKLWKQLKWAIEDYERFLEMDWDKKEPGLQTELATDENHRLAGFNVLIRNFDPGFKLNYESLGAVEAALAAYRKRASKRFPLMLRAQVPMVIDFDAKFNTGGTYASWVGTGEIMINPHKALGEKSMDGMVKTMAHEMGHHLHQKYLSGQASKLWDMTIRGDYGAVSVQSLLDAWPDGMWTHEFAEYLAPKDSIMSLQVDALMQDHKSNAIDKKEDLQALYDEGTTTLNLPKTPISGYATKNSEEAFCEAVGLFVAYGPRAVHERILRTLRTILPGDLKMASRTAASQQLQTLEKLVKEVQANIRPFISYWQKIEKNSKTEKAAKALAPSASALLKYLEIGFEDEARFQAMKKHRLFRRLTNFKKLVKDYTKVRDFEDAVDLVEKHATKSKTALQKFAEYAEEAVGLVRYFDSEVVDTLKLQDYTVTLVNARGKEITRDDVQRLDEALKRTNALLSKAGLGSATGGRLFAYPGTSLGGAAKGSEGGVASYSISKDSLKVAVGASVRELTHSLVHELGHRVYFKALSGNGRTAWEQFFGDNVGDPGLDRMIKDWEAWHAKNERYRGSLAYYLSEGGVSEQDKMFWNLIYRKFDIVDKIDPYGRVQKTKGPSPLEQVKAKQSEIKVFLMPVSAYSGKDAHELFAEVLAYMLVDGPQKVEPLVRDVFSRAVPSLKTASRVARRHIEAVIRKEKGEFCVRSPDNPDWNGGCYPTKGEAEKRLQQVEYFKHKKARAIRIDKREVQELSKALEKVVSRKTDGRTPLGRQRLTPRGYPYTVTAVDGSQVPVLIVLDAAPTDNPYYVVDGGVGRAGKQVVVVVGLNGSKPIPKNTGGVLARQIFPVLLHELTHVADKYKGKGVAQDMTRDEAAGNPAYYNEPGEVRAYMQEVVDEASERFRHWDKLVRISPTKAKAVDYLLGTSSTWSEVSPHWTPRNKQLVLKAVVQALDDYLQRN